MPTFYFNHMLKSRFKCANTSLSMISCRILFHSSSMASFKESRSVIPRPRYIFRSKSQFLSHLYFPHFLRDLNNIVMWAIEFCHLTYLSATKKRSFAIFSEYTLTVTFMNRSSRTFFSSNMVNLVNLVNLFHTIYVPFIFWMIINNSCSTLLTFYPNLSNNYFLFVREHHIVSW